METARAVKGISQTDLARMANVNKHVISNLEQGKQIPDDDTLGKIGIRLGISLKGPSFGKPIGHGSKDKTKEKVEKKQGKKKN